ncbi:hypothetical protein [Rhodothermus marinus]|uniref:hypothetical protein n=1 Tax=Rhodothermus marinus TaxID=29549 RepID=UPI0012BA51A6|nr:hypothetical protein [Rhodothermus marinus]BBM68551.1 hypothetical protein RmaAA213_03970 [Rhodothermus marinus]BBM71519.1 hypothetical protein RmaAA338_03840 [Rhodothermus marinus]
MRGFLFFLPVLLLGLAGTGCSPRLVPLYYDYCLPDTTGPSLQPVARALASEGWEVSQSDSLHLETAPRSLQHWGLYRVVVRLEAVPVDGRFVRVFIHPYRHYITGRRSKIPYLPAGLRATLLPRLHAALKAEGLEPAGTAFQRDHVRPRW